MGIFFSVEDSNVELEEEEIEIIDKFFDELHWKE